MSIRTNAQQLASACAAAELVPAEQRLVEHSPAACVLAAALAAADAMGQTDDTQRLIEVRERVEMSEKAGRSGVTALHDVCYDGYATCVQLLLSAGADVEALSPDGNTALHVACSNGHPACAELLLAARADVNATTNLGLTSLQIAAGDGHAECARLLLSAGADVEALGPMEITALTLACSRGHSVCAELLLSAGADVGAIEPKESTALFLACAAGHVACTQLLLSAGADAGALDRAGNPVLHVACLSGHAACAELLLSAGAGVDALSPTGATALHVACTAGHAACAELLLAANANVNATEGQVGMTALHVVCELGHAACAQLLISAGADLDSRCIHDVGVAALHIACGKGHVDCVELLITARATVEDALQHDQEGACTPLRWACGRGQAACARLLLDAGADMTAFPALAVAVSDSGEFAEALLGGSVSVSDRLQVVQLLCARGASMGLPTEHEDSRASVAAAAHEEHGASVLTEWLARAAAWTTRLHHVELLSEAEAVEELRAGADVHAGSGQPGGHTPLTIALAALSREPQHGAAAMVVAASQLWSPATHRLFPTGARARAVELLVLGYRLSAEAAFEGEAMALRDVWVEHVVPHAVHR